MTYRHTSLTRRIAWATLVVQISLPVMAVSTSQEKLTEEERWLAGTASTLAPILQEGGLSDYARAQLEALPQNLSNKAIRNTLAAVLPESQLRGGISLENGTHYRSAEFDLFFPMRNSASSLLFGQFGLRDHDSSSFNGRRFFNAGLGYRSNTGEWLLGVNTFLDADIRHQHIRGSLGLEAFRDTLSFSGNYYFPLTGWKASSVLGLHDERPAQGFDLRAKGALPDLPWFTAELSYEHYFGDKVDILGNDTLTRNPSAIGGTLSWRPVPLIELRGGYRDAGSGGAQTEGGLQLNYTFGVSLSDQLNPAKVRPPAATVSRDTFVDRNYDMVMEYREQASKIQISAPPVSGVAGDTVILNVSINSRYPVTHVEWSGDAELLAGLQTISASSLPLRLPVLPLMVTKSQEYSLYVKVTDSRGTTVTSERIPVTVYPDTTSYRTWVNVINADAINSNGSFEIAAPLTPQSPSVVVEWQYVRERSEQEWVSLKPKEIVYRTGTSALTAHSLGGEERDGHWVERVRLTLSDVSSAAPEMISLHIDAVGSDGYSPVTGRVMLRNKSDALAHVQHLTVQFTPGTVEHNGSTDAPVIGSILKARTECDKGSDCTQSFVYQWAFSADGTQWTAVEGASEAEWILPAVYRGESLQNKRIRVKIVSAKDN